MRNEPISLAGRASLTRISVSGNGNHYLVRNGGEEPALVCRTMKSLNFLATHLDIGLLAGTHIPPKTTLWLAAVTTRGCLFTTIETFLVTIV